MPNSSPSVNQSIPFDLDQVSAFGGLVSINSNPGGDNAIVGGSLALDNYASAAEYSGIGCTACTVNGLGYNAGVTINVYNVGPALVTNPPSGVTTDPITGNPLYSIGSLVATANASVFVPWIPVTPADSTSTCAASNGGPSFNGTQCGVINLANFTLNSPLSLSSLTTAGQFIYTVSLNNDSALNGSSDNPVDSLNFALNPCQAQDPSCTAGQGPTYFYDGTGFSDQDTAYYNQSCSSPFSFNPLTCGVLAADTGWSGAGYGEVAFDGGTATPEPATFGLIGFGLVGLGFIARKKKNNKV